jgi:hypothetical protein
MMIESNGGTLIPFEPGKSGNPNGRPKGAKNRATVAKAMLAILEKGAHPITGEEVEFTQEELITLAMIRKARRGDVNAYNAVMNSAHGLPKFGNEDGDKDETLIIRIT